MTDDIRPDVTFPLGSIHGTGVFQAVRPKVAIRTVCRLRKERAELPSTRSARIRTFGIGQITYQRTQTL
jgi:hypothetical protein